jgi:hypothetical protein
VPTKTSPESPPLISFKRPFAPVSNSIPFYIAYFAGTFGFDAFDLFLESIAELYA